MAGIPQKDSGSEKVREFLRKHPNEELRPIEIIQGSKQSPKVVNSFLVSQYQGIGGLVKVRYGIYLYDPAQDHTREDQQQISNGQLGTGRPNQASKRSTAGSGTEEPSSDYSLLYRSGVKQQAKNKALPAWFRLYFLALAKTDIYNHAEFEPGELLKILSVSSSGIYYAIKRAVENGVLEKGSNPRCLILPRGMGDRVLVLRRKKSSQKKTKK
jgi:hypothetical protein